jgi:predicted transposase YbfD/YdcC
LAGSRCSDHDEVCCAVTHGCRSSPWFLSGKNKGQASTERRYYISSATLEAEEFNRRIRAHWQIENQCHWLLDVVFHEDDARLHVGHGAHNFAILRRIHRAQPDQEGEIDQGQRQAQAGLLELRLPGDALWLDAPVTVKVCISLRMGLLRIDTVVQLPWIGKLTATPT